MEYAKHFNPNSSPQSRPAPGKDQVRNQAGGYVFKADDWAYLDRFLVLGTEGATYYASEADRTYQAGLHVHGLIATRGPDVVKRIASISAAGRAPKNDPAIFALALCAVCGDDITRREAYAALPTVCRIGTHLFQFVSYMKQLKGGSMASGYQRAIGRWYNEKSADQVAFQAIKYKKRHGWSHRDVLKQAHVVPSTSAHAAAFEWIERDVSTGKREQYRVAADAVPPLLMQAFDQMHRAASTNEALRILRDNPTYPFEAIPSQWLAEPDVWKVLLPRLGTTALIRNLGRLGHLGLLEPLSSNVRLVTQRLADREVLKRDRIHPVSILAALLTYRAGHGARGSLSWSPNAAVVDALDEAFYGAFGNVEPSGLNFLVGLDVSASMTWGALCGVPGLYPLVAGVCQAMLLHRTEPACHIVAFSHELVPLELSSRERLDDAVQKASAIPMGATDCAKPMQYALQHRIPVGCFVVITDNETWYGDVHPFQALQNYRQGMGIQAKMVVVGMTATEFSIADPSDMGSMDVCGFDLATPQVISQFAMQ